MVAHLIPASYVACLGYHLVYSGAIGNRRRVSKAAIGAAAAKWRSVPQCRPWNTSGANGYNKDPMRRFPLICTTGHPQILQKQPHQYQKPDV